MLDLVRAYENYLTKVKHASSNTVSSYMREGLVLSVNIADGDHPAVRRKIHFLHHCICIVHSCFLCLFACILFLIASSCLLFCGVQRIGLSDQFCIFCAQFFKSTLYLFWNIHMSDKILSGRSIAIFIIGQTRNFSQ